MELEGSIFGKTDAQRFETDEKMRGEAFRLSRNKEKMGSIFVR